MSDAGCRHLVTHLFYVVSCFCTSFDEHYIQLFGFSFSFLDGHLSGEDNTESEKKQTDTSRIKVVVFNPRRCHILSIALH